MLNKGFGDVGDPKGASTGTTGSQFLEQYKTAQALAQLAAQHSQTGAPNTTPSSWDTSATSLGQYGKMAFYFHYSDLPAIPLSMLRRLTYLKTNNCSGFHPQFKLWFHFPEMKNQAESAVHMPFTKRQPYQAATSTSSMLDVFLQEKGLPPSTVSQQTSPSYGVPPPASSLPKMAAVPSLGQQVSPNSSDVHGSSPLMLQQHKLKQQKKKTSISSKVTTVFKYQPI